MSDLTGVEREAMERAKRAWLEHQPLGLTQAFEPGWLAARDYYEKRHVEQQAGPIEALAEAERRERALRALEYARGQEILGRHDWCDDTEVLAALEGVSRR